ncbi:MAG: hypothetical protein P0Y49_10450 [Candidatus Pedobacter colombiensis]|uniref:DUF4249 domain-containing protein n=1 Tax=Candidatus Pedobacter colombiensis TaxID=3121371 RepID=A0AAJ6B7W9_9SPHI|nr:hypothetical protein [Pedobacter sp.]WEK21557.1 MAG: hypothetical protein P0Y49_10450 [Pedobacter sp.]
MKYLWFILVMLTVTYGCKNSIDDAFIKPRRVYDLAVEGGYNTGQPNQYIRLTKPSLNPDSLPTPISKASVVINDSKSDIVLKETPVGSGVYMGISRNDPNYNEAYKLTIKYNGKTYTAVDTLRQVINIIDDFLPLSAKRESAGVITGTIPKHTFGYLNANKWFISYSTFPNWNPAKFDQTKFYSYTHSLGSPNSLYPLNNLKRTFSIENDSLIRIFKISLSEGYAQYQYSVFMETDWSGLFSGVPVNATGNISGNVQGYFSAVDVDFRRYKAKELL